MNRRSFALGTLATLIPASARAQVSPSRLASSWPNTDFAQATVSYDEIRSGGVPKDGIPALYSVEMIRAYSETKLAPKEAVLTVSVEGADERAYPIRYLMWHEIANDSIDGLPVAVTYCPLCNSGLTFDRRVAGQTLSFGVSGMLRFSDMIMYDRETESWWQQFTGDAIVGTMVGERLSQIVSWMEPYGAFQDRNPRGAVMAEPQGIRRPYGRNPYEAYDSSQRPFLYSGENPPHGIPPLMRVVRVGNRAWPLTRFDTQSEISEAGLRLVWTAGMASPLDTRDLAKGRDVGSIRVFNAAGQDVVHEVVFAFAFHAFEPNGTWMLGG